MACVSRIDPGARGLCARSRPRTSLCALGISSLIFLASGCADECVDDGVGQQFCPGVNTETGEASETSADATASEGEEGMEAEGTGCPTLDVILTPTVPTMQILVDQSGSMTTDFGGTPRWDAVIDSLVGSNNSVVASLQSDIRFGLSLYTGDAMTCPAIQEIPAQLDARDEIQTLFAANAPANETPTGESFAMVAAGVAADPWPGDKFIILATDGEPDTCAVPNPDPGSPEETEARDAVVTAVSDAYDEGIRTFVISVGDQIAGTHLQAVANAGAGVQSGDPDATYYQALDQQALVDAFNDIIAGVRDCTLALDTPLTMELAPSCTVSINDSDVPYEDPNGWNLVDETTIELVGNSCTQIQEGVVIIEMRCTCEVGG